MGSHLSFRRLTWCPVRPQRIQGKTVGRGYSVCVLEPTSPSPPALNISGGLARPGRPSKAPFFCPAPLGRAAPNIYAKSTSPNCRISLQPKFFLSPLTTAVNYKSKRRGVWVWVTGRRGNIETQWKGGKKPGNISSYITDTIHTHTNTHTCTHEH